MKQYTLAAFKQFLKISAIPQRSVIEVEDTLYDCIYNSLDPSKRIETKEGYLYLEWTYLSFTWGNPHTVYQYFITNTKSYPNPLKHKPYKLSSAQLAACKDEIKKDDKEDIQEKEKEEDPGEIVTFKRYGALGEVPWYYKQISLIELLYYSFIPIIMLIFLGIILYFDP